VPFKQLLWKPSYNALYDKKKGEGVCFIREGKEFAAWGSLGQSGADYNYEGIINREEI